jgi:GNAT superfamily N-acetyltransferase
MVDFTVRAARASEALSLTALCVRSKAHWGYDEEFMQLSSRSLTVTPELIATGRVLIAENGTGVALGVAAVAPMEEPESYDLDRLFVDPAALGAGVGRALFLAIARLARGEGAKRLVILADPNASAFYERMGAVRIGDAPSDSVPGRTLPLFELNLQPSANSTAAMA